MSSARDLSAFYADLAELEERLTAAKANRGDRDELQAAMQAMNDFRQYWREIGVAAGTRGNRTGDVPAPAVKATAEVHSPAGIDGGES